jgi:hypothetical protein
MAPPEPPHRPLPWTPRTTSPASSPWTSRSTASAGPAEEDVSLLEPACVDRRAKKSMNHVRGNLEHASKEYLRQEYLRQKKSKTIWEVTDFRNLRHAVDSSKINHVSLQRRISPARAQLHGSSPASSVKTNLAVRIKIKARESWKRDFLRWRSFPARAQLHGSSPASSIKIKFSCANKNQSKRERATWERDFLRWGSSLLAASHGGREAMERERAPRQPTARWRNRTRGQGMGWWDEYRSDLKGTKNWFEL